MAKGSLLGRADSTLAAMSYKEAMADVTPDLKDVYSAEALNQALFQTGVEGYFDKLYADSNALADELKEATTAAMADLSSGAIPDDEGMELYNTYLTGLKDKMKSIPKGKKGDFERSKIRAELSRLKNSTSEMDKTLITLGTMIENKQFNPEATGNENLTILTAIANKKAKREIVNGNLIYSIPNPRGKDIKMTQSELRDAIVQSNPEEQSGFIKIGSGWNTKGKQTGTEFDLPGAINAYRSSFLTKKGFADNIHTIQGSLKYTFAKALSGKDPELANSVYKTLMDMGETTIAKYDADKDGDIDAADFANAENGVTLVKALTDIHAKGENGESIFDFQAAKEVAAKFYADNIAKKEFDDGVKMRTKKVDKDKDKDDRIIKKDIKLGPIQNWGTQADIDPEIANSMLENIKTGTHFPFMGSFYDYDVENGQWVETNAKSGEETARFDGAQELSDNVFKTPHPAFQNLTTTVKDRIDPKTGEIIKEKKPVKQAKGTYVISAPTINMKTLAQDDDEVVKNLNDLMPTEFSTANPNGYKFDQIGAFPFPDDPGRQAIQLLDGSNKNKVAVWPKGHKYAGEKVGLNIRKNKKETLDWINDILITFGLADNMKAKTSTSGSGGVVR